MEVVSKKKKSNGNTHNEISKLQTIETYRISIMQKKN